MKLSQRIILTFSLVAGFASTMQLITHNSISNYVKSDLTKIMRKQEEKLGIIHEGMPDVGYYSSIFDKDVVGTYNSKRDFVNIDVLKVNVSGNNDVKYVYSDNRQNIDELLNHELGHFYVDKLSERIYGRDWPKYSNLEELDDVIRLKLISEGIAEYFENVMMNENLNAIPYWPKKEYLFIKEGNNPLLYKTGFHIVNPIINIYRTKGIEYLILNIPKREELDDLHGYQERILSELHVLYGPKPIPKLALNPK
ncbi:MAG TPA: hypothetical protein VEC16_01080 [Alphaproteobacteria bacterium]|nr:hypothetical protein [Alphaproteobacteria bacterium]